MKAIRLFVRGAYLTGILLFNLFVLLIVLSRNRFSHKRKLSDKYFGDKVARFCQTSGGAFLKIGQLLGTRYDLFSEAAIRPLQELQDSVRPLDSAQVIAIIESGLQKSTDEIFTCFDLRPVASASIAQVHKGQLKDGMWVAVKVLRPGIKHQYRNDLLIINLVLRLIIYLPWFKHFPLLESFEHISKCLMEQTDFNLEIANNRIFQEGFRDDPFVIFPNVVEEYCTNEILVMEYFADLRKVGTLTQAESADLVVEGLKALYRMVFVIGFIHSDLHQSNFFRYKEEYLVILDTGLVAELSDSVQKSFRDFFASVVFNDAAACADVIKKSANYCRNDFDYFSFKAELSELLNSFTCLAAQTFEVSKFVLGLFSLQRKYGLYSTSHFTMPILSMLVFEGITKKYYPDLDFQRIAVPFLISSIISELAV